MIHNRFAWAAFWLAALESLLFVLREAGLHGHALNPAFGKLTAVAALLTGFATALSGALILADRPEGAGYSNAKFFRALGWHILFAAIALGLRIVQLALLTHHSPSPKPALFALSVCALGAWLITIQLGRFLRRRRQARFL